MEPKSALLTRPYTRCKWKCGTLTQNKMTSYREYGEKQQHLNPVLKIFRVEQSFPYHCPETQTTYQSNERPDFQYLEEQFRNITCQLMLWNSQLPMEISSDHTQPGNNCAKLFLKVFFLSLSIIKEIYFMLNISTLKLNCGLQYFKCWFSKNTVILSLTCFFSS